MICIEDGSRLTGDDAPMKKDAERWLMEHPNYILDQPDDEEEPGEITHHAIPPVAMNASNCRIASLSDHDMIGNVACCEILCMSRVKFS